METSNQPFLALGAGRRREGTSIAMKMASRGNEVGDVEGDVAISLAIFFRCVGQGLLEERRGFADRQENANNEDFGICVSVNQVAFDDVARASDQMLRRCMRMELLENVVLALELFANPACSPVSMWVQPPSNHIVTNIAEDPRTLDLQE